MRRSNGGVCVDIWHHVRGANDLTAACKRCMASLFTVRAIAYRQNQGYPHMDVARNMGFSMEIRRAPAADRAARVREAAARVGRTASPRACAATLARVIGHPRSPDSTC